MQKRGTSAEIADTVKIAESAQMAEILKIVEN